MTKLWTSLPRTLTRSIKCRAHQWCRSKAKGWRAVWICLIFQNQREKVPVCSVARINSDRPKFGMDQSRHSSAIWVRIKAGKIKSGKVRLLSAEPLHAVNRRSYRLTYFSHEHYFIYYYHFVVHGMAVGTIVNLHRKLVMVLVVCLCSLWCTGPTFL